MPILNPRTRLNIIGAQTVQQGADQRVLLVGQMLSGTATAGVVSSECPDSATEINALFGAKSHIAMLARAFKAINKATVLDILPLADNGAGTAASATITAATGTATADATIEVWAIHKDQYRVTVDIASGDDQDAVAAAIDAALSAAETNWPFTTTSSTNVVTITAGNKGTLYNGAPVGIEGTIPGVALTLTAFASGATDPTTISTALSAAGNVRYQTVGWPWKWSNASLKTFLNDRFNDEFRVMDGVGVQAKIDTYANLNGGPSENSQSIVIIADNLISGSSRKGSSVMAHGDWITATFCAIRALRLTADASLTDILATVAPKDQFGGSALSSLPYQNTLMPNLPIPLPEDELTLTQLADLTDDGYTTLGANQAYNAVILGQAITTYKTNTAGDPDTSFRFLNTVDTSSAIREYNVVNLKARYAQTRLTTGDLIAGRDMANEASIRAFCKSLYQDLAELAIVEAGATAEKDFTQNLIVSVSVSTGTVTINMAPLQVGQIRTILGTIAVKFAS